MVQFNIDSRHDENARFKKVLFGYDGDLLEVELNELQDIVNSRLGRIVDEVFGTRPIYTGTYAIASNTLTITNELVAMNKELIFIPTASIAVANGDTIYLNFQEKTMTTTDTIKQYGNLLGANVVTNYIKDSRVGAETTRRVQVTYQLTKTNVGSGTFLKLCTIASGAPVKNTADYADSDLYKEVRRIASEVIAAPGGINATLTSHIGSGGSAHANAVASGAAGFMTGTDKAKLDGIATGAEVNQNAFQNVKVGATTIASASKTDTVELASGNAVTLTPDAATKKVTVAVPNATASVAGAMSSTDKSKLDGVASGAEVNQNAYANVKVGATTIAANAKSDTLTVAAGTGIAVTGNAATETLTIAVDSTIETTSGAQSKADAVNTALTTHKASTTDHAAATTTANGFMSSADKTKLNGIATSAEVNQNAFSNVKVGATTIASGAKSDTVELVAGNAVALTPDSVNKKVTVAVPDATTSASGALSAADKAKLDGIASGASGAQNVFTIVRVAGQSDVVADSTADVLTLAGGNATSITTDAVNDVVTIATPDATTTASGAMSASDKTKLNGIATGAEVNQNSFNTVKVGATNIASTSKTDVLEIAAGSSNITVTPDATTKKVTFDVPSGTTAKAGLLQLLDSITSTDATKAATANSVKLLADWVKGFGLGDVAKDVSGTDLNNLDATGFYRTTGGLGTLNAPNDTYGWMIINQKYSSVYKVQTAVRFSNNESYFRGNNNGVWGAWSQLATYDATGKIAQANLPLATTAAAGIAQLNDTIASTSTSQAATANAVKQVVDWVKGYGLGTTTSKSTAADLNTLTETGFYYSSVTGDLNRPTQSNGWVLVQSASAAYITQIFIVASNGNVYSRTMINSVWTAWKQIATTDIVTTSANGLMIAADKSKLDGIAANASKVLNSATNGNININGAEAIVYTHPSGDGNSHVPATGTTNNTKVLKAGATANSAAWGVVAASEVTQDASNRFVSDTEKSTWNAKASTAVATTTTSGLMSAADKALLNGISPGAEVNQNAFATVSVGGVNVVADAESDTLTINATAPITATGDATNDAVTIAVNDGTTSAKGVVQLNDTIASTSVTQAATANAVKQVVDFVKGAGLGDVAKDISSTDLNNLDTTGFYRGVSLTNSPNTANYYFILNFKSASNSKFQIAARYGTSANEILIRVQSSSTSAWSAWTQLAQYDANGKVAVANLPAATTSAAGIAQLVDSITSTATDKAATANAVKLLADWVKGYGLGGPAGASDWNAISASGFYAGATNGPLAATTVFGFHTQYSTNFATQFVQRQGRNWTRNLESNVWGPWVENANIDSNGLLTPATEVKANGLYTLGQYQAEKSLGPFSVANGVANTKADIAIPNANFHGVIDVTVVGQWGNANAGGKLTKRYIVTTTAGGTINYQKSGYTEIDGVIGNFIALGDLVWDATNSVFRIQIASNSTAGNNYSVHAKIIATSIYLTNIKSGLAMGATYTTDTTVLPTPVLSNGTTDWVKSFGIGAQVNSSTLDANTLDVGGLYYANPSSANLPTASYYKIFVNGGADVAQLAIGVSNSIIYYRSRNGSTWTAWKQIATTDVVTTTANGLMSSTDKSKLDGIAAGAEVNQNAFATVSVGGVSVVADAKSDTLTIAATAPITVTGDATNDKVTIAANAASTSAAGVVQLTDNYTTASATTAATANAVKKTYDDLKANAQMIKITDDLGDTKVKAALTTDDILAMLVAQGGGVHSFFAVSGCVNGAPSGKSMRGHTVFSTTSGGTSIWGYAFGVDYANQAWINYYDNTNLWSGWSRLVDDKPPTWTNVTPGSSWVNYGVSEPPFGYRKVGSEVRLRGVIKSGTFTQGTTIYTLPSGYRPAYPQYFIGLCSGNTIFRIKVGPDGVISLNSAPANNTWIQFDGITFDADGN